MYDYIKKAVDSGDVMLEWDYSKGQVCCILGYLPQPFIAWLCRCCVEHCQQCDYHMRWVVTCAS
jgi:hypothetical protein